MVNGSISEKSYEDTLISIKTLIAGKKSREEGKKIFLKDLNMELER